MPQAQARALPAERLSMIPLSAAGREPLFFFGTLMDRDVLTYVLGRPVDVEDLAIATLDGFRRVQVLGRSYPMLVPGPAGCVQGRLFLRATARDIRRINHFESGEYHADRRFVRDAAGADHWAWLYVAQEGALVPSEAPWTLEVWTERHKAGFFADCDGWMADSPA